MNTLATTFSSEDHKAHPIPPGLRSLMGRDARNQFHNFILTQLAKSNISQAELARRSGKTPAVISRWLSSAHNWTIETAAILLFAISGERFVLGSEEPFENSRSANFNPLLNEPNAENRPSTLVQIS